jgi:hypothetical protein
MTSDVGTIAGGPRPPGPNRVAVRLLPRSLTEHFCSTYFHCHLMRHSVNGTIEFAVRGVAELSDYSDDPAHMIAAH